MAESHFNVTVFTLTALDVILEPYFLFLVIRKSTPAMRIYRRFLIACSLCNSISSITFSLASPVVSFLDHKFCVKSSTLPPIYVWIFWQVATAFCMTQLQLSLLMLIYASYEISHPLQGLNLRSKWLWAFLPVFILAPSVAYSTSNYVAIVTLECYDMSYDGPGLGIMLFLCGYAFLYSSISSLAILKIRRFSTKTAPQMSTGTLKLIKNVVKNFLISSGIVAVLISTPVVTAIALSLLSLSDASSFVFGIALKTITSYASVSTTASIFIFTSYRQFTLKMLRKALRLKEEEKPVKTMLFSTSVHPKDSVDLRLT
ncbi:hypothetical protein L596_020127 [Steinernema carpocapsae]|uniref:G-protein coupled receptors family 1 profile domain-containing protein n=1 Tax=Steinernema carpocapsae TaxID=34508 RepID=A0A4U5MSP0_STECR|nr:hypothetical protein L596_020127 [Steinernema carpocapsae]